MNKSIFFFLESVVQLFRLVPSAKMYSISTTQKSLMVNIMNEYSCDQLVRFLSKILPINIDTTEICPHI